MDWVKEHLFWISVLFVVIIPAVSHAFRVGFFNPFVRGWFAKNTANTVGEIELHREGLHSFMRVTVHALDRSKPGIDVGVDIVIQLPGKAPTMAPLALSAAEAGRLARLLRAAANY